MENKFQLFETLQNSAPWDALIVIKNLFNKETGNQEVFQRFFDFAYQICSMGTDLANRNAFLSEAEMALIFFSENTEMNSDGLEFIKSCQEKLRQVREEILEVERKNDLSLSDKIKTRNDEILNNLVQKKTQLFKSQLQSEYEHILAEITKLDSELLKHALNKDQKELYDSLTREYTQLINEKMLEINKKEKRDYNIKALNIFKNVFDTFKKNESKYKDSISELTALVTTGFLDFDASQLYNDTLIYYNHVYSFIFNSIGEDQKYHLTRLSIKTEKLKSKG